MTPEATTLTFIAIIAALFIGVVIGVGLCRRFQRDYARLTETTNGQPNVIVNIPDDLKPFPQLTEDGRVIAGERAVLWYSVYALALDDDLVSDPCSHANCAVEKVFGPFPPTV